MSETLSITSRQLAWTVHFSMVQSVHSPEKVASMRGMATSSEGRPPSGSFQMKSNWFCSQVGHDFMRALGGIFSAYGIALQTPSPPQFQLWNAHTIELPRT